MSQHAIFQIADRWGRKFAIVLSSLIFVLGGILQVVATNMGMMLAGRFFAGCEYRLMTLSCYLSVM
jgi:predicted MFS family arabinose efflux permease